MAGVSWKTVSNVIHGSSQVRPETRQRVEEAIARLGYRMTVSGRQLRRGRSGMIALAVPDLTSPYFSALARHIIRYASDVDHVVLIDDTAGDAEQERSAAGGYAVQFADGVILSPASIDSNTIARVHPNGPVVVLGERDLTLPESDLTFDHVAIDNVASARELTEHLVATGRRRLAFIGSPENPYGTGQLRQAGFVEVLQRHGLHAAGAVGVTEWDRQGGEQAVSDYLATGVEVDALVCGNDLLAIGAMQAIRAAGRTVGRDIAVVGWDDTDEGRYANPALTSVAHDLPSIARTAVDLVLARLDHDDEPVRLHTVDHRLVVRASSDPPLRAPHSAG